MHVYEKPVGRMAWLLGFIDLRELLVRYLLQEAQARNHEPHKEQSLLAPSGEDAEVADQRTHDYSGRDSAPGVYDKPSQQHQYRSRQRRHALCRLPSSKLML